MKAIKIESLDQGFVVQTVEGGMGGLFGVGGGGKTVIATAEELPTIIMKAVQDMIKAQLRKNMTEEEVRASILRAEPGGRKRKQETPVPYAIEEILKGIKLPEEEDDEL